MERGQLSGAGGNWRVIDEVFDPKVIKQQDSLSCGPACGEMLFREQGINDFDQAMIAAQSGTPVSVADLASVLNSLTPARNGEWQGRGFVLEGASFTDAVEWLTARGVWAAELREAGSRIGHLVIVNGFDDKDRILIRDPWNGTSYKMDKAEFVDYWTLRGIRWVRK